MKEREQLAESGSAEERGAGKDGARPFLGFGKPNCSSDWTLRAAGGGRRLVLPQVRCGRDD